MTEHPGVARVLPETRVPQLDRLFDYRIPPGVDVHPGMRVKIPLGRGGRQASGVIVETAESTEFSGELADIEQVVSEVVVVPPELFRLAGEVASRHAGGLADVLRLAVPPRAVRVEKAWLAERPEQLELPAIPEASPRYTESDWSRLTEPGAKISWRLPHGVAADGRALPLAHEDIARVAGSILGGGESVVVVAPDWRDVELIHQALSQLLPEHFVARFEATHTTSERYRNYLRCLTDNPVVVVGTRHAVYAPVCRLGAVIVVNDDDDSHREQLAPYPHTRDVALIRTDLTGARLIVASVAPSIHAVRLEKMGFLTEVAPQHLTRPRVIPTELTTSDQAAQQHARIPSIAYRAAKTALEKGPVLVQVFHSGFAPGVACAECGERARCPRCQGPLRSERVNAPLLCGWCGHRESTWKCAVCSGTKWKPLGQGVGRTVSELGKAFPGVRVIQADGAHRHLTLPPTPGLVVSTRGAEPVVPGGYRLALLLDGQRMLQRESLSAMTDTVLGWERALALLAPDGVAYLTDLEGPIAQGFASGALDSMMQRELRERTLLQLPPAVRLASIDGPREIIEQTVASLTSTIGPLESIGPISVGSETVRVVLKVPYSIAPAVAKELRAAIIRSATRSGKSASKLKVSMNGQHALDELTASSQ